MGKTYRSFDHHESFDEHDHMVEYTKKKIKKNQIKQFVSSHQKDRKYDQLEKLDRVNED